VSSEDEDSRSLENTSQKRRGWGGGVGGATEVKERSDGREVKEGLLSRKCQTFAMCGTGSDSKAGEHVSISAGGEVVVFSLTCE
jgi:hypothetical protein